MRTVQAAVVRDRGAGFELVDIEMDDPGEHEVVIGVRASGLCHSDLGVAEEPGPFPFPILLGHEVAGVVERVGAAVSACRPGDHVVVCGIHACGLCAECRRGRPYRCRLPASTERPGDAPPRLTLDGEPLAAFMGIGGFAEAVLVHENLVVRVDPAIPFDRAALLGFGVVTGAGAALNTAGVGMEDTVAVIGCGGVGLNVIQGAALGGARRVIAVDLQPSKLALARRFGATDTVQADAEDPVARIRELTDGGVSCAFEVIGRPATARQALEMLTIGGTAYLIGVQPQNTGLDFALFEDLIFPQKALRGVSMGSTIPQVDIPRYVELYLQGRFRLDELVSRRIGLGEIDTGYETLRRGGVARAVVTGFSR